MLTFRCVPRSSGYITAVLVFKSEFDQAATGNSVGLTVNGIFSTPGYEQQERLALSFNAGTKIKGTSDPAIGLGKSLLFKISS